MQDGKLAWENIAQLYSDFGELEDFDTYIDVLLGGGETAASYADQMEVLTEMTRQKIVAAAGGWESLAGVDERVLTAMLESAGVENATAVATDMLTEANEKLTQVIEQREKANRSLTESQIQNNAAVEAATNAAQAGEAYWSGQNDVLSQIIEKSAAVSDGVIDVNQFYELAEAAGIPKDDIGALLTSL